MSKEPDVLKDWWQTGLGWGEGTGVNPARRLLSGGSGSGSPCASVFRENRQRIQCFAVSSFNSLSFSTSHSSLKNNLKFNLSQKPSLNSRAPMNLPISKISVRILVCVW